MTKKKSFYLPIINILKVTTNLSKIQEKLSISKQLLNYYLRRLQKEGYIFKKGIGWFELTEKSKNMTNHDKFLRKDMTRGHAYVWKIDLGKKKPLNWDKRIEILEKSRFKYKLVGAKENTPRIKILGRKVWLCNDYIRVYDKPKASYYGENAIESRKTAFYEILLIVGALNNKLNLNLKPHNIYFQKEHYALIKNDLAIECNKKREKVHVSDEYGEWLLIDDSLGQGGELENIGKKAFQTNIPMQRWWNDNKKHNFKVTPTFLMESISGLIQTQQMNADNIVKHQKVLDEMLIALKRIQESLEK
jgi:hypothetical protein